MKKILITAILLVAVSTLLKAQDYQIGLGLRGGTASGITVKHFISDDRAIEGILGTRWRGFMLSGLYEIHATAFDVDRLKWYYGGGLHAGFWSNHYHNHPWWDDDHPDDYMILGVGGVIGLEYTLKDIPFSISLDWQPILNLVGLNDFWFDMGGIAVRYTFGQNAR